MKDKERDIVRIQHIRDAIQLIEEFTLGLNAGDFVNPHCSEKRDQMLKSGILIESYQKNGC